MIAVTAADWKAANADLAPPPPAPVVAPQPPATAPSAAAEQQLLRRSLIDLSQPPTTTADTLARFTTNQQYKLPEANWTVRSPPTTLTRSYFTLLVTISPVQRTYSGDATDSNLHVVASHHHHVPFEELLDGPIGDTYTLINSPPGNGDKITGPLPYAVNGSLVISGCGFDFATNATCYPSATIHNSGSVQLKVLQPNLTPRPVAAGKLIQIDRSEGDATITFDEVQANVFPTISMDVRLDPGPDVTVGDDVQEASRFQTYSHLADLHNSLSTWLANTSNPRQSIKVKEYTTAIHVVSAEAVKQKYPDVVLALLTAQAKIISTASDQVLALRKLAVANTLSTPDEANITIARIDKLLKDPHVTQRDTLTTIRNELVRARDAAIGQHTAVDVIQANLGSAIDLAIASYQTLVLEYAQVQDRRSTGKHPQPRRRERHSRSAQSERRDHHRRLPERAGHSHSKVVRIANPSVTIGTANVANPRDDLVCGGALRRWDRQSRLRSARRRLLVQLGRRTSSVLVTWSCQSRLPRPRLQPFHGDN